MRHAFSSIPPKMDLTVSHRPNPLLSTSSTSLLKRRPRISRRKPIFRASASSGSNRFDGSFWLILTRSVRRGSEQFWSKFGEAVKKETGFDLDAASVKVGEFVGQVNEGVKKGEAELTRFSSEFVNWNQWELWKDFKNWDPKRIGVLVIYTFAVIISFNRIYIAIRAPFRYLQMEELTNAYMEALIPDPSPDNIKRFKKGIWRKATPEGLKMKKYIKGLDGTLIHDDSFVGQDAWEDDSNPPQENVKQTIDNNVGLTAEENKGLKEDLGISDEVQGSRVTWRERLNAWKTVLINEKIAERLGSLNAKYVVDFDMKEVENSLRKDVVEKVTATHRTRALWISKRWWCYRPKLPYTYFLEKLDCSEVAAVVFTEDLKRLYITMKEGFPSEYIVDIPLDPYLFEIISSSGVEVDLLQKQQIHYFMKFAVALVPGVLMLCFIGEAVMFLRITSKRIIHKKYNQLNDMAYAENFTMPVGTVSETKSMYKEVVVGGDVWDLLDELMLYMKNPLQYYEREVPFVRGVLLSGPPGTGKTLFARTLSKKSGLPFIYASGAEFTSGSGGPAKINEMFNTARKNAPAFIFIDEIDAIAGRHTKKDLRRKSTFMALLEQLDGEKIKTGVDRFSAKQAVIFICATNIPEELDPDFVRPGRIDRRVHIGLPNEKQRVQIFGVHSAGQQLAEDVDFGKLAFRTVGYSGADIRNLVNEAAIMAVRKGHSKIYQEDIVDVLDKQLLEGMGVLLTEDEQQKVEARVPEEKRRLLAVHEAGHILLAHLFPRFDWHAFSQLLPGGKEIALSVFYPREDMLGQAYTTFGYLKMQMVVAHGGRCAERIVYGDDITDGGNDDLIKITRLAREMVISPQNKRLGLLNLIKRVRPIGRPRHDDKLIKYQWDDPNVIPANMTPEVSELFTRELTRYIEETEELAMNGLRDNRHILDMIAEELFEKSRITGLEVIDKLKGLSPIMFDDFVKPFQINLEEEGPLPHNDRIRYQPGDVYPAPLHRC